MRRPESVIGRIEMHAQHDMAEHARRLRLFHAMTVGKVWREQPNGQVWLVPVIDGSSSSRVSHGPRP